jgi:hypothetical protein
MNTNFEPAMSALFTRLVAAATVTFTANATAAGATLTDVSDLAGLFPGLPVFGPGVVKGATVLSLDPEALTVTLSAPVGAAAAEATFTTGFLTTGRRVKPWSQVTEQPALFLRRMGTEDVVDETYTITTLLAEIWIYSKAGEDPDAVPDVALSNLDQMVRASLAPDGDYGDPRCTLGGVAYWARIEGRSDYAPGDISSQGISRIPVRITLP